MADPEDYSYLWNGSQPGWVLLRINRQTISVTINFAAHGATLRQVAAVRAVVASFSAMRPSEALAALKGKRSLTLGPFDSKDGRLLADACVRSGLTVKSAAIDASGYLPFNDQSQQCLIIEDDDLAELVAQKAIAQGVSVRHVEA